MAFDAARAKTLFLAASDLADPAERAAYLDRECGGDAELRARVEALLRANDAAPLPTAPEASVDSAPGQPETEDYGDPTAHVGALLAGKYKLIEEIGVGGMGRIFMAQQAEPVKRAVAVKVIKAGMDSRAVLARFEAERQALAMMDHPNIAKVLDAGTTEGGRPFFVMELVKGMPITRYCDEHKLTPRQRLELFVPVCQAIQHAHQKGIIHRDIKPSNVLVAMYDDRPVPKVIDFGVAKAAGQTLTDKTLMTGFGAMVGTPEYMSPEQASLNNLDIDTRSDIYSLGVLLYELLTGATPVDKKSLGKAALVEILRIVREVEAPRPSAKLSTIDTLPSVAVNRGTEPAKLSRLLKGELDWLVLRALEKDRTRRYETVNSLVRDIQRYLADEVVEARPPSVGYRVSKFVRRHKGRVIAASLVLVALVGGVIGTTIGLFQARAAQRAEAVQRKKAETAAERERLAKEFGNSASQAYATLIGEVQERIRDEPALRDFKKRILLPAIKGLESLIARMDDNKDAFNLRNLADAHLKMGRLYRELGQIDQAYKQFEETRKIWESIVRADPNDEDARVQLAAYWQTLGDSSVHWNGDAARAREAYKRGLTIAQDLVDHPKSEQPPLMDRKQVVGDLYYSLGDIADGPVEAREYYTQALTRREELRKANPDLALPIMRVADCYHDLAKASFHSRDLKAARGYFAECLKLREEALRRQPQSVFAKLVLAFEHERLGDFEVRTGNPEEGKNSLLNAQTRYDELLKADPKNEEIKKHLSRACYLLGTAYLRLQERQLATRTYSEALEMRKAIAEKDSANLPKQKDYMVNLARCGQYQAAAKMAEEIYKKSPNDVDTLLNLMRCYALCSMTLGGPQDETTPAAGKAEPRDAYAASAADYFEQAVANGFKNVVDIETDPDIDAIQNYAPFKHTLEKLRESVQR
jgi:serine/threonine protein kinase/tetratricopeptide (TPR) repeat protein